MKEFPAKFTPKNLPLFQQYKYDRDTCYLREAIYEHFIKERPLNEEKKVFPYEIPFDLDAFSRERSPPNFDKMVLELCKELTTLGWETYCGCKNSSLWVYPAGQKPKSLPDW